MAMDRRETVGVCGSKPWHGEFQPGSMLFLTPRRMNDVLDNSHSVAPNRQRMDGSKRAPSSSPGGAGPTKWSSNPAALTSRTLLRLVRFQGVAAFTLVCLLTAPLNTVNGSSHSTDEEARELKRAV